ncbi:lipopolysaccharide biosynthesis protein [Janthinobacterium sp. RB2P8]|uniref:lipopolysaccharide biosynthesis protein n=1 Tax=Janthinobacterium sp. RB2P8 TaxID=3424191 RepID=UPI003F2588DC
MSIENSDMKESSLNTHTQSSAKNIRDDGFNLSDLAVALWRSRGTVAGITALTMVLGLSIAVVTGKYKSEGFFQFGGAIPIVPIVDKKAKEPLSGITLANYKRYAAVYNSADRYADYFAQTKLSGNADAEALLLKSSSREGIATLIEPVFPFTKLDAKEFGMETNKEDSNNIIGLRIMYTAATPESAQKGVALLGNYAMDTIIYQIYADLMRFKDTEISAKITQLDNDIIEQNKKIEELSRKNSDLKIVVSRYPAPAAQGVRQVVSITEETARYLSPTNQLMTNEIEIAETKEELLKIRREKMQLMLFREYYAKAKELLNGSNSGEAILRGLEPIKVALFKDKDLNDEVTKEVFNRITISNKNAINLYLEKSRFIAGPNLPKQRAGSLLQALLISLVLGLVLSACIIGGRTWWKNNQRNLLE